MRTATRPSFRSPGFWLALALILAGGYLFAAGRLVRGPIVMVAGLLVWLLFRRRPSRRHLVFAAVTVAFATLLPIVLVVGLDLYLHHRYADTGGYNIWGYRGPSIGRKRPGERRVAVLGGSTAFGYGVKSSESYPSQLERTLNELNGQTGRAPVRVVNLGWNGAGAYSFRFTLEDYDYLEPDLVILDSGYNDMSRNRVVFRRESELFRRTGYLPILPLVSADWLHRRDLDLSVTSADRIVFRPGLADRSSSKAADLALGITQALEREMRRLSSAGPSTVRATPSGVDCGRWTDYCQSLSDAVRYTLDRDRHVLVVTEPYGGGGNSTANGQRDQQNAIRAMLTEQFAGEGRLHYVDLGRAINLTDPALCYDGMHLTASGNGKLAGRLALDVQRILSDLAARENTPATPVAPVPSPLDVTSHVPRTLMALGRYESARDEARKALLEKAADKPSSDELAEALLRLNQIHDAKETLEQQIANRVDDVWTHYTLYLIAAATGDRTLLEREVAWAETGPDRFVMLSAQADVAAAGGRLALARKVRARAVDDALQHGRKDTAGAMLGRQAIAEVLVGEPHALEDARTVTAMSRQPGQLWASALVHALAGRPDDGVQLANAFKSESRPDVLIDKLWMPVLQAGIHLGRGDPQKAIDALNVTVAFERGTYWPRYLRGLAYLNMRQGVPASLEFSRILTQPLVGPTDIMYVVAERQFARATALGGMTATLAQAYATFFESWKHADPDLALVGETREEYRDLRGSISLPDLPEGLWRKR